VFASDLYEKTEIKNKPKENKKEIQRTRRQKSKAKKRKERNPTHEKTEIKSKEKKRKKERNSTPAREKGMYKYNSHVQRQNINQYHYSTYNISEPGKTYI